jgi:hypothetical protein
MNNTQTLAVVAAILIAASLVVGGTIAATTTTPSAFAVAKKKSHNNGSDKINGNGNTDTDIKQKCKQFGSGFDYSFDQDCELLNNSNISEAAVTPPTPPTPTPQPTTGTLLVNKICICSSLPHRFSIQITGNNAQPSTFILTPGSSQVVTLGPGIFMIFEEQLDPGLFSTTFSGDCTKVGEFTASGAISVGQHLSCTITNEQGG